MPLPRAIARFNKRVTNRFIEPIARRAGGFAAVHHIGRRSGVEHSTPVNIFPVEDDVGCGHSGDVVVALTYGPSADWVQNVLADGGALEHRSSQRPIGAATVVTRSTAWPALPIIVRAALRVLRVRHFLRLTLLEPTTSPT